MELDERKFRILQAIIDDYILTAMPVGSRTISKKYDMGLSSATIRNEMSDLEELGYLAQPHTSAGRIPSWKAYRLYVDQLMRVASLPPEENRLVRQIFKDRMDQMEDVLSAAARALSELTDYTGVMIAPQAGHIQRVQLVPITETTALMVTVTDAGVHKDSVVNIPPGVSPDHLYMLSGFITEQIKGKSILEIQSISDDLAREVGHHKKLFSNLIDALVKQMKPGKTEVVVGGASRLLSHPEYNDIDKARSLLNTLETKDQLAGLLSSKTQLEFSIAIGPELKLSGMQDSSLVTVSYMIGGGVGTMGVIGPTRMKYGRVLSVLGAMRQALTDIDGQEGQNKT